MKKKLMILVVTLGLIFMSGCAGTTGNVIVNKALDASFYLVLSNNPSYKTQVVASLETIQVFLGKTSVTYDDLIALIAKQFAGKFAYIAIILTEDLATDKPIFETYLPMLDSYKAVIVKKIDRLIFLSGMVA